MEITISTIVPVYNAEKHLKECIDSLVNQQFKNFEIILVDDGSFDKSPEICDEYAKIYDNITVIHQENKGQIEASKRGLSIAKGEYISFIDSDDFISPSTYKEMSSVISSTNSDIITMAGIRFSGKKIKDFSDKLNSGFYDKSTIGSYIIPNLFSNHDLYGNRGIQSQKGLKLFKASLIRKVYSLIPSDIEMGEDVITTYTAIINADSMTIMDKNLIGYHYRMNPNSISWTYKKNLFNKSMKLCSYLRTFNELKHNKEYQLEVDYEVCFFAINAYLNEYLMKNTLSFKQRKENLKNIVFSKELSSSILNINIKEVKMPNKLFISLMKKKKTNTLHLVGILISVFRKPIILISQKVI